MDDGGGSSDVIKRRLPSWMSGVAAADKERFGVTNNNNNNLDIDDGCRRREDEGRVQKRGGRRPKSKAAQKKRDNCSDDLELEEVEEASSEDPVGKRGERKRTKRKLNLDAEVAPKNKKQKGKAKRKFRNESSEDAITGDCSENDEDENLTVDDLMIFAKEWVQGDIGAQDVESIKEDVSAENQFGDTVRSGNSSDVLENKRSSEGQEMGSSGFTTGNVDVTSEGSGCKPSMSGNPTQDMLDLFLGPLLKKTQEKEKKVDLSTDEIDLNYDMKRQNTSSALGEKQPTVAVAKKKSSLRDRVAMFLD